MPDHADPLGQKAGSREGVLSSLIGITARTSIETGETVKIDDLVKIPPAWNKGSTWLLRRASSVEASSAAR